MNVDVPRMVFGRMPLDENRTLIDSPLQLRSVPSGVADSKETHDRIIADTKLIQAWGVDGTPSIIVNGKYRPAQFKDFDELNAMTLFLVNKELKGGK